jgi:hypothetical protein
MKICNSKFSNKKENIKFLCTECNYGTNNIQQLFEHYYKYNKTHYIANLCKNYYDEIFEAKS